MSQQFKVYFSMKQLEARGTNFKLFGNGRQPWMCTRLIDDTVVPYTQLIDEDLKYEPMWPDTIFLGIAYRDDIACCDVEYETVPIFVVTETGLE